MEKFFKKSNWTDIVISLVFILFGAMLMLRPEAVVSIISFVLGGIAILMGVLRLINYYATDDKQSYTLALAVVFIIVGIIIMFCSDIILSMFRILIAIWIIYSGIINLQTAIIWKEFKSKLWLISLVLSIAMILAGIYVLANNGTILQTVGLVITVYGIGNIVENVIFMKKINGFNK